MTTRTKLLLLTVILITSIGTVNAQGNYSDRITMPGISGTSVDTVDWYSDQYLTAAPDAIPGNVYFWNSTYDEIAQVSSGEASDAFVETSPINGDTYISTTGFSEQRIYNSSQKAKTNITRDVGSGVVVADYHPTDGRLAVLNKSSGGISSDFEILIYDTDYTLSKTVTIPTSTDGSLENNGANVNDHEWNDGELIAFAEDSVANTNGVSTVVNASDGTVHQCELTGTGTGDSGEAMDGTSVEWSSDYSEIAWRVTWSSNDIVITDTTCDTVNHELFNVGTSSNWVDEQDYTPNGNFLVLANHTPTTQELTIYNADDYTFNATLSTSDDVATVSASTENHIAYTSPSQGDVYVHEWNPVQTTDGSTVTTGTTGNTTSDTSSPMTFVMYLIVMGILLAAINRAQ